MQPNITQIHPVCPDKSVSINVQTLNPI